MNNRAIQPHHRLVPVLPAMLIPRRVKMSPAFS